MAEPCQIADFGCQESGQEAEVPRTVCVFNRTRESFLCLSASAGGAIQDLLPASEDGWWLRRSSLIFLVGGPFPMDFVYLDQGNRVVDLIEHLDPLRIVPRRWPHASVLAVRTRTIYASWTRLGDELLICSPEEVHQRWK
jgi:hypothetical protein